MSAAYLVWMFKQFLIGSAIGVSIAAIVFVLLWVPVVIWHTYFFTGWKAAAPVDGARVRQVSLRP